MKNALLLFFVLACIHAQAQIQRGIEKSDIRRGFYAAFSAGTSNPTGNYKSYSQIKTNADGQVLFGATEEIAGKIHFNIDAGYQFGAFGMGLSLGTLKHEISDVNLQSDILNLDFPLHSSGGELDGTYYGLGPEYTLAFGKFSTKASTRIGLVDFSASRFTGSYNGDDVDVPVELMQTDLGSDEKTSLAYSSVGLQLSYAISKQISVFGKTDYAFALGDGLQVTDAGVIPNDIDGDKMITAFDVQYPEEGIPFENIRTVKPRMMNVDVGLTWHFSTAKSQKSKASVRGWDQKEKSQFNSPNSGNTSQEGVQKRKLPIREGGQTTDAGNIPESIHTNDTTWNESHGTTMKRPGRTKYANITFKRGASQENIPIDSDKLVVAVAKDAKLTKADAGNALNAIFDKLSQSLNNGENLQLIHFGEKGTTSDLNSGSNARVADLKKLADELVNMVADEAKLTKADAGNALNAFVANLSNTLREHGKVALSSEKQADKNKLLVAVSESKALRFSIGDPDDDGDGVLDVSVVETDPQDTDGDGYGDLSAMLVVKIDQTLLRNTNAVMTSENKDLLDKRYGRLGIRALRIRDYRHGIRAKHHDERINAVRTNDARIQTLRSKDERIKSARINDARIKTARANDARIKDARAGARADKRHEGARMNSTEPRDQLVEIITDEDFQVAPQTGIDTKYLRIKNQQSVQVDKGPLQLIAPLLSVQNNDESVTYLWTITNRDENTTNSFSGSSIVHDFSQTGTYEIEITPVLNDQKRRPYQALVVVK